MSQEKSQEPPAIVDALGCLFPILLMVGFMALMFTFRIEQAKEMAQTYQKELTTPHGHVFGKVKTVETWKAEKFVHKEGNVTLTLDITDRCKITFEDGRSKQLVGMPKSAIPTDKEVVIIWAKYDIFLEAMDAEEYRKKK